MPKANKYLVPEPMEGSIQIQLGMVCPCGEGRRIQTIFYSRNLFSCKDVKGPPEQSPGDWHKLPKLYHQVEIKQYAWV